MSTQPKKSLITHAKETYIAGLAAASILTYLALRFISAVPHRWVLIPLYITLALGGLPLMLDLGRKLL